MRFASNFIGRPHDFDFLIGDWRMTNRRLRERLVGCADWDEFPASTRAWSMQDGCIRIDETDFSARGFHGSSVRSLDRATQQWAIHWIDSRSGRLFAPVHGGFDGTRGEFHGDDVEGGRAVRVRFLWTLLGADAARWEQAFAPEGGAWETNWVMEFRRAPDAGADARERWVERYIAVWNEADAASRRAQIAALWRTDGAHCTPSMAVRGHAEIERRITTAHEKWVRDSGHRFRAVAGASGHHGGLKFHWEMVTAAGEVSSLGFDFVQLDADGRIVSDHQFIEPMVAAR